MSTPSLRWLTAFLATLSSVAALPLEEKRALGDWVTATIDGQLVSWQNDWSGLPTTSAVAAPAPASTTPASSAAAPPPTTAAPAPVASTPTPAAGQVWVTATIDGNVVSWVNNWPPPASSAAPAPAPAPASTTAAAPAPTNAATCDDVHIFLAKGNNEPYPGRQGVLAAQICADIPSSVSCGYENILYDNTLDDNYCDSVTQGDRNGVAQLTAYAASCPLSKLVLSGYSQGSNIIGDILGGGGGEFGKPTGCDIGVTAGINPYEAPGSQIVAAMVFGNNRHVANQPYNVLNGSIYSTDNPRYPDSLAAMNLFSDVLRDYCDESDPVCALEGPGPFVIANHLNYFDRYTNDAAAWVAGKLGY